MLELIKTIETPHDPCLIVTNDISAVETNGLVLVAFHHFGSEDEKSPRLHIDDGKSVLLDQEQLRSVIAALSEFLEEDTAEELSGE